MRTPPAPASTVRELERMKVQLEIGTQVIYKEKYDEYGYGFTLSNDVRLTIAVAESELPLTPGAIQMQNSQGQNAFHYIFSGAFMPKPTVVNSHVLRLPEFNAKVQVRNSPYITDPTFPPRGVRHPRVYNQYLTESQEPLNDFITRQRDVWVRQFLTAYPANSELKDVLMRRDNKGNTPLHDLFLQKEFDSIKTLVGERIQKMSEFKQELLNAANANRQNLAHLAFAHDNEFKQLETIFGREACHVALKQLDEKLETPFHIACKASIGRAEKIQVILDLIKPITATAAPRVELKEEVKGKEFDSRKLFRANKDGQNPLHLICDSEPSADNKAIIENFKLKLGDGPYLSLLQQKDVKGMTPLHYAVAHKNKALVQIILDGLPPSTQLDLLAKTNISGETPLHLAYVARDTPMVTALSKFMGPYEFHKQEQSIKKKSTGGTLTWVSNLLWGPPPSFVHELKAIEKNPLFECVDYLLKNAYKLGDAYKETADGKNYKSRLTDFIEKVVKPLSENEPVEPQGSEFQPKSFLGRGPVVPFIHSQQYYNARLDTARATKADLDQIVELLNNPPPSFTAEIKANSAQCESVINQIRSAAVAKKSPSLPDSSSASSSSPAVSSGTPSVSPSAPDDAPPPYSPTSGGK